VLSESIVSSVASRVLDRFSIDGGHAGSRRWRIMSLDLGGRTILGIVPQGAAGPSRAALLLALIDRARHDRAFAASLRREPVGTARQMGLVLRDSEWGGLRDFLID
jgi:hypothetical protein